jgi:L-threonylcarbamoyladenylate synthase
METIISTDIQQATSLLQADELIAIPTETVYGLAGNALSTPAIKKIYDVKKRPYHNPLIVHLYESSQIQKYTESPSEMGVYLLNKYSPGPLTVIFQKNSLIPDIVTAGMNQVALRIPKHPITLSLLSELEFPIAAPSANPFGYISPTTPAHVLQQLGSTIPFILDGGPCQKGVESTVISASDNQIIVHRLGAFDIDLLFEEDPNLVILNHETGKLTSPGMLKQHYSPRTRLHIYPIQFKAEEHSHLKIGFIGFTTIPSDLPIAHSIVLSKEGDLDEAAFHLYDALHRLDAMQLDLILIETVPSKGLGMAINDRINRAVAKFI